MSETALREPADNAPTARRDSSDQADVAPALGLIGLQPPGRAIALTLSRAGLRPLACDPDPALCRAYAEAAGPDADVTDAPAEVATRCDIIVLALAIGDDAATIHAALQHRMGAGGIIIDMGPALPATLRQLAAELAATDLHLIDALLLPTTPPIVLAGGPAAPLARAIPILDHLGTVIPTGRTGSAQALAALIAELDPPPSLARIHALVQAQKEAG
jgi:3-hydroxyisobutyrate dehydrogenase-like beta-hydroxyacid dehydrogenase